MNILTTNDRTGSIPDVHLDLGCGAKPRNPYRRRHVVGVDIRRDEQLDPAFELRVANLATQPIPFDANTFGSVSAYDFIEHVPRVLRSASDETATVFPFVILMNEIWRVLAPGGRLFALTPCYPCGEIFQDPTHINFITDQTHNYFAGDYPWGRMYGFIGLYKLIRARRVVWRDSYEPLDPPTLEQKWRRFRYKLKGRLTHIVWEFECRKPSGFEADDSKQG